MKPRIFIGLPVYQTCHPATEAALERHMPPTDDVEHVLFRNQGNPIIDQARMECLAEFLKLDPVMHFTHFMQLDADVWWAPGSLERMLGHNVDVLSGMYPFKAGEMTGLPCLSAMPGTYSGPLIRLFNAPGGFLLIARRALERTIQHFKEQKVYTPGTDLPTYALWQGQVVRLQGRGGRKWPRYFAEDYAFSWRLRQAGNKLWAARDIHLRHCKGQQYWELPMSEAESTLSFDMDL